MSHDHSLQARVDTLEALEELRALKATYARLADVLFSYPTPENAAALANLFTEDGRLELGPFGAFTGREAIRNACENILPKATAWSMHYMSNPNIAVSGESASGTWYFFIPSVGRGTAPASVAFLYGRYLDQYRKTPQGWRIQESIAAFEMPPL